MPLRWRMVRQQAIACHRPGPPMDETNRMPRQAGHRDVRAICSLKRAAYAKWILIIGREPGPIAVGHSEAVRNHLVYVMDVDEIPARRPNWCSTTTTS